MVEDTGFSSNYPTKSSFCKLSPRKQKTRKKAGSQTATPQASLKTELNTKTHSKNALLVHSLPLSRQVTATLSRVLHSCSRISTVRVFTVRATKVPSASTLQPEVNTKTDSKSDPLCAQVSASEGRHVTTPVSRFTQSTVRKSNAA